MNEKITPFTPIGKLFLMMPDTEFSRFCIEINKLWEFEPKIGERIQRDLDLDAKKKKRLRLMDKQWETRNQMMLPIIEFESGIPEAEKLKLLYGRPRMTAYVAFMFMMGRGYYGGIKSSTGIEFTAESMTLYIFLQNKGISMPSANTVYDNINAISNETRNVIFDAQIRKIADEGLDDFKELTIDSTAVAGNVCWPRDSSIISHLMERAFRRGKALHLFGLTDMRTRYFPRLLKEAKSLSKQINMEAGKPKSEKKRRQHYRKTLKAAGCAVALFQEELTLIDIQMQTASLPPSQYQRLQRLIEMVREDIAHIEKVRAYCAKRIFKSESTPSKEKIISTSDGDAAYIQKGNREATIGYKPQLGRSDKGFVSSLIIPLGNASDSDQLEPTIEDSISRTKITPDTISTDDGYVNQKIRNKYMVKGVKVFSFSGSKGKRLLSAEEWESQEYVDARNDRSAVESLMYTIKYGFDFDRVMRRGIENVRAELMEKVLAYNACRSVEIRQRRAELPPSDRKKAA